MKDKGTAVTYTIAQLSQVSHAETGSQYFHHKLPGPVCDFQVSHICPGCGQLTRTWDDRGRCRGCGEFPGAFFPQAEAW